MSYSSCSAFSAKNVVSERTTVSEKSDPFASYNSFNICKRFLALGLLSAMFITTSCQKKSPDQMTGLSLPQTPAIAVVDTVHGLEITDNYRWLEDGEDATVRAWADTQDAYTRDILSNVPGREFISARLGELFSIGVLTNVTSRGDRYFYSKREGSTNQPILYYRKGLEGVPKALLDPNEWSDDGTVAIDWYSVSSDGALVAYGVSAGGDENSTLHIIDVDSGEKLSDTIPNARAAAIAWLNDNSGFYYTKYPTAGTVPEGDEQYFRRVFFHNLGQDPENDPLIFGEGLDKADWPHVVISDDNRWLIVMVFKGWSQSSVYVRDLNSENSNFVTMVENIEAMYQAYPLNDRVLILTNEDAPMYRLMEASLENPQRSAWREIIPESEFKIEGISPVGDKIIISRLAHASSRIELCDRNGKLIKEIELPTIGSVGEISGEDNGSEFFLNFSSYFVPPSVYRYDLNSNSLELFDRVAADIDESLYQAELITFQSKDKTDVTMFVVSRKDAVRNGKTPALLYGYGGFNQSMTPSFARNRFLFMEQGGIYIDVHLRGGGEYGEAWHKAGMLENKQNTYDDFIAAAEYLIAQGYTSKEKLVIQGGSNGGLLVGAALVQRPDLFSVVVCQVPLLDMVRYHKFLIARLWIPEYGDPDKPEDFEYIYKYSPYHHVKEGAAYPSTMILTGESDTRVDPLHARKMTALLQWANSSENPIMVRVEKKSGHGQGSPLLKILDTYTDIWSFVFWRLGIEPS